MNKKKIIASILFVVFITITLVILIVLLNSRYHVFKGHTLGKSESVNVKDIYYCPMHPNFTSDKPGNCAICGMSLVKNEKEQGRPVKEEKKIIYYRNPMDPQITSPVPMKDQMGMDYVPVYEKDEEGTYISPERQQFVGMKTEKVEMRPLSYQVLTVGKVAYDPELYIAQEEYLQALKTAQATKESVLPSVSSQSSSVLASAEKKLMLLGMSKNQIEELAKRGISQENLYLSATSDIIWVYITIYEYEMGMVKEGMPVVVEAVAFPGDEFSGKITAFVPVLDPMTRSVQARAEISDPKHKLKPEMFVNTKINIDLGERLAVSEEAVINTGKRNIVVVTNGKGNFSSREVKLGQKAGNFYEVLEGLKEGDIVVTSGNFLIDSESRLQSAISGEHKHGQ